MKIYICQVCGYEYNEAEGDIANGIPENTKFEDLPETWVCPICGVDKTNFEEDK